MMRVKLLSVRSGITHMGRGKEDLCAELEPEQRELVVLIHRLEDTDVRVCTNAHLHVYTQWECVQMGFLALSTQRAQKQCQS